MCKSFLSKMFSFLYPKDTTAVTSNLMDYLATDPVSNIHISMPLPLPPSTMSYKVQGFDGNWQSNNVKEQVVKVQAGDCYITIANSINHMQRLLNDNPLKGWAAVPVLAVFPRAGQQLNAYYDRMALRFFYEKVGSGYIFLADSSHVVAHELGHAFLDSRRPDFWSVQSLEIWAFHEGWADINSMSSLMEFEPVVKQALAETNGDLRKSNVISKLALQVGNVLLGGNKPLRDGVNDYKYVNPETLSQEGGYDDLTPECHSFGRIMMGTWYQLFAELYTQLVQEGKPALEAVKLANDICHGYLVHAVITAPRVLYYHDAVVRTWMALAKNDNSPYLSLFERVFTERNLFRNQAQALSVTNMNEVDLTNAQVTNLSHGTLAVVPANKTIKLNDHLSSVAALNVNYGQRDINLGEVELEVPSDKFYLFDKTGMLVNEILPDDAEIAAHANVCVQQIQSAMAVGPTESTMWEVRANKLERTFVE